jgi:RNA 3'-terminal phosphate cyclase (ATP)
MLEIDGSYGEGGGQILRTAIALSALQGKPLRITNIRANRPKPGLAQQHLTGVKALQGMTDAEVEGLRIGSTEIKFSPKAIKPGTRNIDVGTAGSITLILQALLIPSAFSQDEVELRITGGTDVRWSPPIDYVKNVFYPLVEKMGYKAEFQLLARGYYPKGHGKLRARIFPLESIKAIKLTERGGLTSIKGVAHSLNLPCHIVERLAKSAKGAMKGYKCDIQLECGRDFSTGCGITLWANCENSVLGASSIGEIGKPAEKVGREAGQELLEEIQGEAPLDRHMGDQIIPYMALARGTSEVAVRKLTPHLKTNIYITEKILGNKFHIREKGGRYLVKTKGIGFKNPS